MCKPGAILCVLSVALPFSMAAAAGPDVRQTVVRALPYVVERGGWWIEEKKCVSCHRVAFTTWALLEAGKRGFDVDRGQLDTWRAWARDELAVPKEDDTPPSASTNLEGASQLLLAERFTEASVLDADVRAAFVGFLTDKQRDDGKWDAGGQLPGQKRPKAETELVSTAWNALALATVDDAAASKTREKAWDAIARAPDNGVSTEWVVVRLLLAIESGSEGDVKRWTDALRAAQRDDGGWGWLVADDSDALATGMALYALGNAGLSASDPAIARAVAFLSNSQTADGSWAVNGTKEKSKHETAETASYLGTCWAVLGLMSTLDAPH